MSGTGNKQSNQSIGACALWIAECTTEAFDEVMNVNVRGVCFYLRTEIRAMLSQEPISPAQGRPQQKGSIVNMASIASHTVIRPLPAYTTSKHAILGLTRYAAAAHASDGIWGNTLCTGFIDTPLTRRLPEQYLNAIIMPMLKRG
ncbi:hypothetical protein EV426DRAFT_570748 [Tirmania nivea]|nr:hypothetical protein EV426DRAFT_570748 [Tirmania nivea]